MNEEFDSRLRASRYEASPLELDELKRRSIKQAGRGARARSGRGSRVLTSFLAAGVLLSGGSAVIASTSGSASSGQPSASVSQYQIVAGEKVIPGSARLLAPTGCVSRAFFARVRGVNVKKVVFKLDGKTIKTVSKPNRGASFYAVRINPNKLKIGVHRITATVIVNDVTVNPDTNAVIRTKQQTKTMRISFQRCAKKLAAPRFTG